MILDDYEKTLQEDGFSLVFCQLNMVRRRLYDFENKTHSRVLSYDEALFKINELIELVQEIQRENN